MQENIIAKNYAEALLALANKADNREGFGAMIHDVANAMGQNVTLRRFLESPKVSATEKNTVLSKAYSDRVPRLFLRFLQKLVQNRRQLLIPEIAIEYSALLDEAEGRVHADVTVANAMNETEVSALASALSKTYGKTVVPHVTVNPEIMGGMIVKVGDTVMDGSVRHKLGRLAHRMRVSA